MKARTVMGAAVKSVFRDKPRDQTDPLEYDRSVLAKARRERSAREQRKGR